MNEFDFNNNISNEITPKCPFCYGTGVATFVDVRELPICTIIGDENWKKFQKIGACPEKCETLN